MVNPLFRRLARLARTAWNALPAPWRSTCAPMSHPARPKIHRTAILAGRDRIHIAAGAEIQEYVIIRAGRASVSIGEYAQINPFTVIYGGSGVTIGRNAMIAPHCTIAAGNHDYRQLERPMRFAHSISRGPITIGDNAWIGANCTITDGVTIGREAVVAAGSVVTHDVPDFAVVAGVPARVLFSRLGRPAAAAVPATR